MLVGERMSRPGITIQEDMPILDALDMMKTKNVRRFPVLNKKGNLVGIVSKGDLLNASPSDASSLSVWEMNYLLSKVSVRDVMSKKVVTVSEKTPIEEAAYVMSTNKIGGLPVVTGDKVIGIITETDLFRIFLEMMGAQEEGLRVTALVPEKVGELASITQAITAIEGNITALGTFAGDNVENRILTFKVTGVSEAQLRVALKPHVLEVVDIQNCC
jgi:acetoin utilization protein AcuB